jgi:hypothetical protein
MTIAYRLQIYLIIVLVIFCWHLEGHCREEQDPNPLVRGSDPDSDPLFRGPDLDQYLHVTDPEHWVKRTEEREMVFF